MSEDRDFAELLASVARELVAEPDVQHTVQRTVELAAAHLDGHVYASVSLVQARRRVVTPAASDDRATRADVLQYELEQGPCLDAIWEHETYRIDDLSLDQRYPRWSRQVVEETGIRSSLSFQLFTSNDSLGALNLYSPEPRSFGEQELNDGVVFAAQAAVALQSARTEEQLQSALSTRTVIGQAQGLLMERYDITAERAFDFLRRTSQDGNLKLYEVARRLVATRKTPTT